LLNVSTILNQHALITYNTLYKQLFGSISDSTNG